MSNHFNKEGSNIVSIWVSSLPLDEIPESYFEEHYGDEDEDDDKDFNQFSADFDIGFYDHDFVELLGAHGETNEETFAMASYGSSFLEEAIKACNIPLVGSLFLMYDFEYDAEVTGKKESQYFTFIGTFKYDKSV